MAEKRELEKKKISYQGLFKTKELYGTVQDWAKENGYDFAQEKHSEIIGETGKEIKMPLELEKKASDYVKFLLKCGIELTNVEEVLVKKGEKSQKLNKGDVAVNLKAVIETDYDDKWHKKPLWMFLKGFHDKFLKADELKEFESQLKKDLGSLTDEVKAHLNLFRYRA